MAARLILARHPLAASQRAGRFLGSTDMPLGDDGRRAAEAMATAVAKIAVDRVFVSPLRRTVETAEILGVDAEIDPDLREVDFGRWEEHSFNEITASDPELVNRWAAFDLDFSFPDGDNLKDFLIRVAHTAVRLAEDPAETVLAITHGGVIRAMICHLLGLGAENYLRFEVATASLTTIDIRGGHGVLVGLNDTHHLDGDA